MGKSGAPPPLEPDLMRREERRRMAITSVAMALPVALFAMVATMGSTPLSTSMAVRVQAAMPDEPIPTEEAPTPAPTVRTPLGDFLAESERGDEPFWVTVPRAVVDAARTLGLAPVPATTTGTKPSGESPAEDAGAAPAPAPVVRPRNP
jgi:hypothetical protein